MNALQEHNNFGGFLIGLALPAGQSLVTGFFLFLFLLPVSSVIWVQNPGIPGTPLLLSFSAGMGATFAMWVYLRSRWHSALEQMLNIDLNNDGVIGQEYDNDDYDVEEQGPVFLENLARTESNVKVFVHEDKKMTILNMPIDSNKLYKVAKLLLPLGKFTYADFAGPGKLLSRSDYECLRQELVARGILLRGQKKSASPILTRPGRATMQAIIAQYESTPSSG